MIWAAEEIDFLEIFQELSPIEHEMVVLGDEASMNLAERRMVNVGKVGPSACRIQQFFSGFVGIASQEDAVLALFNIDCRAQINAEDAWVPAEVLSALVHCPTGDCANGNLWLRAGPEHDTGWVEIRDVAAAKGSASPFRAFSATPTKVGALVVQGVDSGNRNYFLQVGPRVDPSEPAEVKVAWRESTVAPLTRQGIAEWLVEHQESLGLFASSSEIYSSADARHDQLKKFYGELPSSLLEVPTSSIWLDPLPQAKRVERRVAAPELNQEQQGHGIRFFSDPPVAPRPLIVPPVDRVDSEAESQNGAPGALFGVEGNVERGPKILAVRATPTEQGGFEYEWDGLRHARTTGGVTDDQGYVVPKTEGAFSVILENDRFRVRQLFDSTKKVRVELDAESPPVFVTLGPRSTESLAAANAFLWLNDGMRELDNIYPWLSQRMGRTVVSQGLNSEGDCRALHTRRRIYLPFYCPQTLAFVPKAFCGDVALHEAIHELSVSLVLFATRSRYTGLRSSRVEEALSDFLAIGLRNRILRAQGVPEAKINWFKYGLSCQGDSKNLRSDDPGHAGQNAIVRALVTEIDPTKKEFLEVSSDLFEKLARLASLATLYGFESEQRFFVALIDFADRLGLGEDFVSGLCASLHKETGTCYDACGECVGISHSELIQDIAPGGNLTERLKVFGHAGSSDTCQVEVIPQASLSQPNSMRDAGNMTSGLPSQADLLGIADFATESRTEVTIRLDCKQGLISKKATLHLDSLATSEISTEFQVQRVVGGRVRTADNRRDWVQLISEAGRLIALENGQAHEEGVLGRVEIVATEPVSGAELLVGPNVAVTDAGDVSGWTKDGVQFEATFSRDTRAWQVEIGDDGQWPRPSLHPQLIQGQPIAIDPTLRVRRVDVLDLDAESLTVAQWGQDVPSIETLSWPNGVEVDVDSLEVGFSPQGTIFSARQIFPPGRRQFRLGPPTGDAADTALTLIPANPPWVAFADEAPSVTLRYADDRVVRVAIDESFCKAPPYLKFDDDDDDEEGGGTLLALTCDGVAVALDVTTAVQSSQDALRQWTFYAPGVVVPDDSLQPIQLGRVTAEGKRSWVLGPFRRQEKGGRVVDRVVLLDDAGERVSGDPKITTQLPSRGAPKIFDSNGDGCDEIALASGQTIGLWRLQGACGAN